jgi:hypothetical protein
MSEETETLNPARNDAPQKMSRKDEADLLRVRDLVWKLALKWGPQAMIAVLLGFAGTLARHAGVSEEQLIADFRGMLARDFRVDLVKVVVRRMDDPGPGGTVQ